MEKFSKSQKQLNRSLNRKKIFIFLGGNNFWEGLFDNINVRFIRNLFEYRLADFSQILMTIIVPGHVTEDKYSILRKKEENLKNTVLKNGANIEYCHIKGRTISGLLSAFKEISTKTVSYNKQFIWATNYFNCFLGTLIKRRLPNTHLHFEMMGLAPEEELYYSESNIISRLIKFCVLKIIERINLKKADSVSVVSKRFKDYVVSKYDIEPAIIDIIPCLYDHNSFFIDSEQRRVFREKYQIKDGQKLILYSGGLQKWQVPDLLFAFFKKIKIQDKNKNFKFMVITFDQEKAQNYATKYELKDLIIDAVSGTDLNSVYNAADIGITTRTDDWVSKVSSPVKIPEYLATKNCLILLESIGDYGTELMHKKYALVKKDKADLLNTIIEEIHLLEKPDDKDLLEIFKNYSINNNLPVIKKILANSINEKRFIFPLLS
jgi:glycosyltransferase involved in cell wall biosynthesis